MNTKPMIFLEGYKTAHQYMHTSLAVQEDVYTCTQFSHYQSYFATNDNRKPNQTKDESDKERILTWLIP